MKAKIGQHFIVSEDFLLQGYFNEEKMQVKEGDEGFIDSNGFAHYETGNARGKINSFEGLAVEGYDTENIAKLIFKSLDCKFNLEEYLENEDYEIKDFVSEIDWILSEIF